jgi:class 3 adenylate cyclase
MLGSGSAMRTKQYTMKERYLAIVLLDIIGSTAFVQKHGALKAAKWFQYHDRMARNLCMRFSGREIDRSDGFLMSFDNPADAVNFALAYQEKVPAKTHLNARIGVHWGKVIEVTQDELWQAVGAKSVELEGISKNIAARTMSLCGARQVLLTSEAMHAVKGRTNGFTPRGTRYACVGAYKFKGVREPHTLYAVGQTIESLQPPKGSEKAKRVGGAKYIRLRARDRKLKEWFWWAMYRLAIISAIYLLYVFHHIISHPVARDLFGLNDFSWIDGVNEFFIDAYNYFTEGHSDDGKRFKWK